MSHNYQNLEIVDSAKLKLPVFSDERGKFSRLFCQNIFASFGISFDIKQTNLSKNKFNGTLRGLHFQHGKGLESKIIICIKGIIFDVLVDLRKQSKSYRKVVTFKLDSPYQAIYVPSGCAHGFQTLCDNTEILYFHSNFYNPLFEDGIRYDDKILSIKWPEKVKRISDRDKNLQTFQEFESKIYEM